MCVFLVFFSPCKINSSLLLSPSIPLSFLLFFLPLPTLLFTPFSSPLLLFLPSSPLPKFKTWDTRPSCWFCSDWSHCLQFLVVHLMMCESHFLTTNITNYLYLYIMQCWPDRVGQSNGIDLINIAINYRKLQLII